METPLLLHQLLIMEMLLNVLHIKLLTLVLLIVLVVILLLVKKRQPRRSLTDYLGTMAWMVNTYQ